MSQCPRFSLRVVSLLLIASSTAMAKATNAMAPVPKASPPPLVQPIVPLPAPAEVKPSLESLLKPKSIKKASEDYDIVTNSQWHNDDFTFVNAFLIRTSLSFARPKIVDFSLYSRMSPAIKKFEYDSKTQLIEMLAETHGLRMHSWLKPDQTFWDVIRYKVVAGDMLGFTVDIYLWDRGGKCFALAKGSLPRAKQMLPKLVALVFKPVSEIVLGVATKNFRSYIEEDYKKHK